MVFKVRGIIEFSPSDKTNKHRNQSSWKRVAMIRTNCDIDKYYSWFIKKRFNLELNPNLRGTHITFISDKLEKETFEKASDTFNGKEIDFYVELEPRSSGKHWWLRVHCPEAENIREIMGLDRIPYFSFHLTLGRADIRYPESVEERSNTTMKVKKDYIEHSEYITECCIRHELTSNEPRKELSKLKVIEWKK